MKKYLIMIKNDEVVAIEQETLHFEEDIKHYKQKGFIGEEAEVIIEADSEADAIRKFSPQKKVTTNYNTGKSVYSFMEVVGWIFVAIGIIIAIISVATFILQFNRIATFSALLLASIPGISLSIGGLFAIATAQVMKATIATAENTQQILEKMSAQ